MLTGTVSRFVIPGQLSILVAEESIPPKRLIGNPFLG
jgi:hypothetical protein